MDPAMTSEGDGKISESGSPDSGAGVHPLPATPVDSSDAPPKRSDLQKRIWTAAVLVPLVTYIIVAGGYLYLLTVLAFGLLAQREFYGLIEDKGARPLVGLGLGEKSSKLIPHSKDKRSVVFTEEIQQ